MACELFQKVLQAHGGLDRWNRFEKVQATIASGGFAAAQYVFEPVTVQGIILPTKRRAFAELCSVLRRKAVRVVDHNIRAGRVVFEAKTATLSVLQHSRSAARKNGAGASGTLTRQLREHFGLTQTELAHALGVSLRTVQNWERVGAAGRQRQLRDLEELWTILKESIKGSDIPAWLRSGSDAFAGERPIELLKEGKARDIIVEFRRLQSGVPA